MIKNSKKINNKEIINSALKTLNEAYRADPAAIFSLINVKVPCNNALADHPTIQVHQFAHPSHTSVGLLGIINGIIEPICGTKIAAVFNEVRKDPQEFALIGFKEYKE